MDDLAGLRQLVQRGLVDGVILMEVHLEDAARRPAAGAGRSLSA